MKSPLFMISGWDNPSDRLARADLFISFDAVQQDNGASATWVLYSEDITPFNFEWPTYSGPIQAENLLACAGVRIIVISASKSNTFSCQLTG